MKAPKPDTDVLIDLLTPSLMAGTNLLSEFEARRVLTGARKLPERYQGLTIEGLLRIICDEISEGSELIERALRLAPYDTVSWLNYSQVMGSKAIHDRQLDILRRAVRVCHNPAILEQAAVMASFWADFELLDEAVTELKSMRVAPSEELRTAFDTHRLLKNQGDLAKDIGGVAKAVMQVAQKHKILSPGSSIDSDGESLMGFIVMLNSPSPERLSALNDEVIDAIIAVGLENCRCVGFFVAKEE